MKDSIICLNKINIKNLKNVYNGSISFNKKSDRESLKHVTGIYGQNGSGKTSIVDSLLLLRDLMLGKPLSRNFLYLISADKKNMFLDFEFFMNCREENYKIFYQVELSKIEESVYKYTKQDDKLDDNNPFIKITRERLSYSKLVDEKWKKNQIY